MKHFDTVGIDKDSFCTVLELCSGPDLYGFMKKNKFIPEKEAKAIVFQILQGLKYINTQDKPIIHYDIKPQNILFHENELKISDFGLAKITESSDRVQLTSQGVGTYWYLPPECFFVDKIPTISNKVDVFSLGVIFYELIYGEKPFGQGKTQDQILKEGIMLNARKVDFPTKPVVSEDTKVVE